jgi:hypothetical protein
MPRLPLGRAVLAKINTSGRRLIVVLLLLILCSAVPAVGKRARPLDHEAVSQVWLGWSDSAVLVYRLDLQPDGTGLGGYVFKDQPPQLFRITSWTYRPERIEMKATPLHVSHRGVERLHGSIRGIEMKLTMSGPDWHEELVLRRERDLMPRWDQLKDALRRGVDP